MGDFEKTFRPIELACKPDFEESMKRVYAFYQHDLIDRPPVRFAVHNSFVESHGTKQYASIKEKWFDCEYQVENFRRSIEGKRFYGETFPVFWCNLGPNVYAGYFGIDLIYDETTCWSEYPVKDWSDLDKLHFDYQNEYFKKTEELMRCALHQCKGSFMVGYTDLHPGMDCVAAWRNPQELCMDLYDNPEMVKKALHKADEKFLEVYDYFDRILKENGQISCTWMGIPSFETVHIPSCDFSSMISPDLFAEFCLPSIQREVAHMKHNIFHLDGEGVARHLDTLLQMKEIQAIQWVPSPNNPEGIFPSIPIIKKIQAANKGVVVDVQASELRAIMNEISPNNLYLCMDVPDDKEKEEILELLKTWK